MQLERFSNSLLSDFIDCPAKYYFSWYLNLVPEDKDLHLEFGNSIHLACEYFFKALQQGRIADKNLEVGVLQMFLDDLNGKDLEVSSTKNQTVGVELLPQMMEVYRETRPEDILAVEKRLERTIKGRRFTGRIDLLLRQKGRLVTIDHKTTARLQSNTADKWQLSRQLIGYQWLTGADDLRVNLFHCINSARNRPSLYIYPFLFSKTKLERWEYQTIALMDMIMERVDTINRFLENPRFPYIPDAVFPRLGTRCISYKCEYKCLCDQDLPLHEIIVPSFTFRNRAEGEYW